MNFIPGNIDDIVEKIHGRGNPGENYYSESGNKKIFRNEKFTRENKCGIKTQVFNPLSWSGGFKEIDKKFSHKIKTMNIAGSKMIVQNFCLLFKLRAKIPNKALVSQ